MRLFVCRACLAAVLATAVAVLGATQAPLESGPIRQVAGGLFNFVVKSEGLVVGWGREDYGLAAREPSATERVLSVIPVAIPGKVRQMAAGDNAAYALLEDGTVVAWGQNDEGQFGQGPGSSRTPENPMRSWRPVPVPGLSNVVQVSAAGNHVLARRGDGSVMRWGTGVGLRAAEGLVRVEGLEGATFVAAARQHDLALTKTGEVFGWGDNRGGQLGQPLDVRAVAYPTRVPGLDRVVSIAASGAANFGFSGAVRDDGTVWMWGSNQSATMGNGTFWGLPNAPPLDNHPTPEVVKGITTARSIVAGDGHVAVLLTDKTLRMWGHDGWGQLGVGTSGFYSASPKKPNITNVEAVFLVASRTYAVRTDGSLWQWGVASTYGGGPFTVNLKVPTLVSLP